MACRRAAGVVVEGAGFGRDLPRASTNSGEVAHERGRPQIRVRSGLPAANASGPVTFFGFAGGTAMTARLRPIGTSAVVAEEQTSGAITICADCR